MKLYELIYESGSMSGRSMDIYELVQTVKLLLNRYGYPWNLSHPDDNMYLFSLKNDYNCFNKLMIEYHDDGKTFEYGHGIVSPDGQVDIFERGTLPLNMASADKIADDAHKYYLDSDLSDYADDDEEY